VSARYRLLRIIGLESVLSIKKFVEIIIFLIETRALYTILEKDLNKLFTACILELPISLGINVTTKPAA
jgi:hypothetical protein